MELDIGEVVRRSLGRSGRFLASGNDPYVWGSPNLFVMTENAKQQIPIRAFLCIFLEAAESNVPVYMYTVYLYTCWASSMTMRSVGQDLAEELGTETPKIIHLLYNLLGDKGCMFAYHKLRWANHASHLFQPFAPRLGAPRTIVGGVLLSRFGQGAISSTSTAITQENVWLELRWDE